MKKSFEGDEKILFIHNRCMHYRIPFFQKISDIYDVDFIFTQESHVNLNNANSVCIVESSRQFALMQLIKFIKVISLTKYDIMIISEFDDRKSFIYMIFSILIGTIKQRKKLFWSESWAPLTETWVSKAYSLLIKTISKNVDGCIVTGEKCKEFLSLQGVPTEKIFVTPLVGSMQISYDDLEISKKLKIDLGIANKRIIISVGRLIYVKGFEYLITAFAKLKREIDDLTLLIIGDGEDRRKIEEVITNLGLTNDVFLLGHIKNENIAPYYLLADVFVYAGINKKNHLARAAGPVVLHEAMLASLPIITTDHGSGAYDICKPGTNAFVVRQKNSDDIYLALKEIFLNNKLAEKMGNESIQIGSEYTYECMIDAFKMAIKKVVS